MTDESSIRACRSVRLKGEAALRKESRLEPGFRQRGGEHAEHPSLGTCHVFVDTTPPSSRYSALLVLRRLHEIQRGCPPRGVR
mgnify:CR=1 FL=1